MDVFSLVKFWRNAGIGDPINSVKFDVTDDDDEGCFFDLVFTTPPDISRQQECSKSPNTPHFFNRKILPLDCSSNNNNNNKTTTTPCRSPFRVLMLGFQSPRVKSSNKEMKYCEIVEEEEEVVTISSLLNTSSSSSSSSLRRSENQMPSSSSSKRFSKDIVNRYLNLIRRPLVVSRSRPNHYKHLGKSRSSSSVSKQPAIPSSSSSISRRHDDSALDGIQSAILHCKKSYSSSQDGCHVLSRSGSAPSQSQGLIRISSVDEEKRSSI
ncbi:hypothetical protein SSX86_018037 [Deinandra increscens subsp. villosa]|uniref:Membrane-associated kinase regulator n=1 Tax=Deinandra increscens subsp. villosa TaxID=3103831 RepID=A0AAP0CVB4_9ASTR